KNAKEASLFNSCFIHAPRGIDPGRLMNVAEIILREGCAEAPAVLGQERVVTYGELRQSVHHIASVLRAQGHAKGNRVGILSENSAFFAAAYFGIIRAGLVAVPLNIELPPEALQRIILDSAMTRVLASSRLAKRIRGWELNVEILTEEVIASLPPSDPKPIPG